jgi:HEAT repeat protein
MPKRLTTEDHLARLRQLRASQDAPQTIPALEQLIKTPRLHGIVLKSAAALAEQLNAKTVIPALVAALESLVAPDAAKRDPGCEAKTAILKTLLGWDAAFPELYVAVSIYHQMEPTFGDPVDSAAEPRGLAALGISFTRPPDAILLLTDLLTDSQKITRAHVAIALGNWRGPEAVPLLRLKARLGDDDPETFAEVLAALLRHDPRNHLAFVAEFLQGRNLSTIEAAALALGQSKLPTALQPLADAYPRLRSSSIATTLVMAIGLLRTPEAVDWLLDQLPRATTSEATVLFDALRIHHHDEKFMAKLQSVVAQHPKLQVPYKEVFHS